MHLSMNLEGNSFLIRAVLIHWNSESIFRPSIFSCILAVLFVIKLLTNSQLYRLPRLFFEFWFVWLLNVFRLQLPECLKIAKFQINFIERGDDDCFLVSPFF